MYLECLAWIFAWVVSWHVISFSKEHTATAASILVKERAGSESVRIQWSTSSTRLLQMRASIDVDACGCPRVHHIIESGTLFAPLTMRVGEGRPTYA